MNKEQRKSMQWRSFVNEFGFEQGKRVKYVILRAEELAGIENLVNEFMDDGYVPSGSVVRDEHFHEWAQPVVFDKEPVQHHEIAGVNFVVGGK